MAWYPATNTATERPLSIKSAACEISVDEVGEVVGIGCGIGVEIGGGAGRECEKAGDKVGQIIRIDGAIAVEVGPAGLGLDRSARPRTLTYLR